jgi:hypothetical protein
MSIAPSERPAEVKPLVSREDLPASNEPTPLYVVCSPRRGVGKTLLSRLLIEFHDLKGRPVAAFDLADEGPQLADFMPDRTTVADISDIFGQMALFDSLISDSDVIKVIDLGHRSFRNFFIIAQKIGFFEEVRRHAIEPLLLFMIDPDPKSAEAYSTLQHWFKDVPLLPVRNHAVTKGMPCSNAFPNAGAVPVSPEIPVLGPSLKALVEQQSFSFAQFWGKALERFPARLDDELRPWMKRVFFQFRQIDNCLTSEDIQGGLEPAGSDQDGPQIRRPPTRSPPPADILDDDLATDISALLWTGCNRAAAPTSERQSTPSVLKFASENADPTDAAFVAKLQQAVSLSNENCNRATTLAYALSAELRDAQQRVNQLEREAAFTQADARSEQSSAETPAPTARTKEQADKRAREKAESRLARWQDELVQAKESAKQASVEAAVHIERTKREAEERVACTEADTDERLARAWTEIERTFTRLKGELAVARQRADRVTAVADAQIEQVRREADEHVRAATEQVSRLEAELGEAKRRAERAEHWISRIHEEIEGHLDFTREPLASSQKKVG